MTALATEQVEDDDVRNTLALSAIGIANRSITVLTQIVLASHLGKTVLADVYFAVEIFPDLFIVFLGSGLSLAAIPVYARLRNTASTAGTDEHWRFASSFMLTVASLFALVAAALMLAAPLLVSVLAPGFSGDTRSMTISLLRIVLFSLAFLGPEAGLRAIFHSHRRFVAPDLARFAYNLLLLAAVVAIEPRIGIEAIGWGMVAGSIVMISIQLAWAKRLGLFGDRWHGMHPAVPSLLKKTPMILVILAWPMVLLLLDRANASSLGEGSVAALGYAARIVMLPIGIIALPIASATYPRLAEIGGESPLGVQFGRELTDGLRLLLFMTLPVCGMMFAARGLVVETLFERGQFDSEASRSTSRLVQVYILSVPGLAITFFLRNAYLALDRTVSLCLICLAAWGASVAGNITVASVWGAPGIALMTAGISTLAATAMILDLSTRCMLRLDRRQLIGPAATAALLSLVLAIFLDRGYSVVLASLDLTGLIARLIVLGVVCIAGMAGYLGVARVLGIREAIWFSERLSGMRRGATS